MFLGFSWCSTKISIPQVQAKSKKADFLSSSKQGKFHAPHESTPRLPQPISSPPKKRGKHQALVDVGPKVSGAKNLWIFMSLIHLLVTDLSGGFQQPTWKKHHPWRSDSLLTCTATYYYIYHIASECIKHCDTIYWVHLSPGHTKIPQGSSQDMFSASSTKTQRIGLSWWHWCHKPRKQLCLCVFVFFRWKGKKLETITFIELF